jgi:hypothetical protein
MALVQRQMAGDNVRLSPSQVKSAQAWQNTLYASLLSLDSMIHLFSLTA